MSEHSTQLHWVNSPHESDSKTYSRDHIIILGGDQKVKMSAALDFKGSPGNCDPEQLFISAISSCHMLTFLAIAELQGYSVASYEDEPVGQLSKNASGQMAITKVTLSPNIRFSGERIPTEDLVAKIHSAAKKNCFIGNSANTDIVLLTQSQTANCCL